MEKRRSKTINRGSPKETSSSSAGVSNSFLASLNCLTPVRCDSYYQSKSEFLKPEKALNELPWRKEKIRMLNFHLKKHKKIQTILIIFHVSIRIRSTGNNFLKFWLAEIWCSCLDFNRLVSKFNNKYVGVPILFVSRSSLLSALDAFNNFLNYIIFINIVI